MQATRAESERIGEAGREPSKPTSGELGVDGVVARLPLDVLDAKLAEGGRAGQELVNVVEVVAQRVGLEGGKEGQC